MKVITLILVFSLIGGCATYDKKREAEISQKIEALVETKATKTDVIQLLEKDNISYSVVEVDRTLFASDTNVTSSLPFYKSGIYIVIKFDNNDRILSWSVEKQYDGL